MSTGVLFLLCYRSFPLPVSVVMALFVSLLLVATIIDLYHWMIPNEITLGGIIAGVAASALVPELMERTSSLEAALIAIATAAAGYALLWAILEIGRLLFGRKQTLFPDSLQLSLSKTKNGFVLNLGGDQIELDELLLRPSDRIIAYATQMEVAGQHYNNQHLYLHHQGLRIDEHAWPLEKIVPFQAEITRITLPREAMGFGDVKFLSCIGAFLGWKGMLCALFGGSILGSIVALFLLLVTRGRMGRVIPFGPPLAAAAALFLFRPEIANLFFSLQGICSSTTALEAISSYLGVKLL
jgi:leader peptidase (prepilin peptidase)/N-methyltransferase